VCACVIVCRWAGVGVYRFPVRRCVSDVQANESDVMSIDGACVEVMEGEGNCWLVKGDPD
jgi:hypothetical protein